jgi:hypothetical protein
LPQELTGGNLFVATAFAVLRLRSQECIMLKIHWRKLRSVPFIPEGRVRSVVVSSYSEKADLGLRLARDWREDGAQIISLGALFSIEIVLLGLDLMTGVVEGWSLHGIIFWTILRYAGTKQVLEGLVNPVTAEVISPTKNRLSNFFVYWLGCSMFAHS